MKAIFKNTKIFTLLFVLVLILDIYVKLRLDTMPFRYMSKPLVIVMLLIYYVYNQKEIDKKKHLWMILGLCSFLIGDIFMITHLSTYSLITGMVFFMIGKIFYCLKFSHMAVFNVTRLLPLLIVVFGFMALLFGLIYENLGTFLIPTLFYFIVSLLTLQFAYLRKNVVDVKSYMLVLIGLELFVVGEAVLAVKLFYIEIHYQNLLTMLLYGMAQYFIIVGVINEKLQINSEE